MRSTKAILFLLLAACSEEVEPAVDAGLALVDASGPAQDVGADPDSGEVALDAGEPIEDIGFGPVGDCLDDSECDDGIFCNGAERCAEGSCVAGDCVRDERLFKLLR